MKTARIFSAVAAVLVLGLGGGCGTIGIGKPGGIAGTGIGDGKVSKLEKSALNLARSGTGDSVAGFLNTDEPVSLTPEQFGFRKAFRFEVTLKEGATLKEGQRVIPGDAVDRLYFYPYWVAPELQSVSLTAGELMPGATTSGTNATAVTAPTAPAASAGTLEAMLEKIGTAAKAKP